MKKLIIVALSAVLAVMAIEPAHAEDQKVLAIIDTAIDSNKIPSVIYEACFTVSASMACPNGQKFMEGKGSATSPLWPTSMLKPVYHGHHVTQSALAINSNLKIVFLRVSDLTIPNAKTKIVGGDQAAFEYDPIIRAIKWVSDNAAKYSIDAVSISQASDVSDKFLLDARYGAQRTSLYNASCIDNTAVSSVSLLNSQNIPVFAATGNLASASKVGFPACINGVVGVGAFVPSANTLEKATNRGAGLDVVAQNSITVVRYNGTTVDFTATSAATPIAASLFLSKNTHRTVDLFINSLTKVLGYPYISR